MSEKALGDVAQLIQQVQALAAERDQLRKELEALREVHENYRQIFLLWAEEQCPREVAIRELTDHWERFQRGERGPSLESLIAELEQAAGN
jgi:hypothetical protein